VSGEGKGLSAWGEDSTEPGKEALNAEWGSMELELLISTPSDDIDAVDNRGDPLGVAALRRPGPLALFLFRLGLIMKLAGDNWDA
jgi:hypothetical protein